MASIEQLSRQIGQLIADNFAPGYKLDPEQVFSQPAAKQAYADAGQVFKAWVDKECADTPPTTDEAGFEVGDRAMVEVEIVGAIDGACYADVKLPNVGGYNTVAKCRRNALRPLNAGHAVGSVWWAIEQMHGGAVCERGGGRKSRIYEGRMQWHFDGEWRRCVFSWDDLAATDWALAVGGGE